MTSDCSIEVSFYTHTIGSVGDKALKTFHARVKTEYVSQRWHQSIYIWFPPVHRTKPSSAICGVVGLSLSLADIFALPGAVVAV